MFNIFYLFKINFSYSLECCEIRVLSFTIVFVKIKKKIRGSAIRIIFFSESVIFIESNWLEEREKSVIDRLKIERSYNLKRGKILYKIIKRWKRIKGRLIDTMIFCFFILHIVIVKITIRCLVNSLYLVNKIFKS